MAIQRVFCRSRRQTISLRIKMISLHFRKLTFFTLIAFGHAAYLFAATWQQSSEMPIPVAGAQAVVHQQKIYIVGGYVDEIGTTTNKIQVFDPQTRTWQVTDSIRTSRADFVLGMLPDSIFIAGGVSGDSARGAEMETWNFSDAATIFDANPLFNRIGATGGVCSENLYLFGGYSSPAMRSMPFIVEYNIPAKTVTFIEDTLFQDKLPYQQMSALYSNRFLLFGGVLFGVTNRVYQFDVNTHVYERVYPNLLQTRAGGQAVITPFNDIYIIGGYNESEPALASVEIYHVEPWGNWLYSGPELITPRREHMAVLFGDSIYVFGGKDPFGVILSSVETLPIGALTGVASKEHRIRTFRLYENHPNPFNAGTTISFELSKAKDIRLDIYSALGQHIKTLVNKRLDRGFHTVAWDGTDEQALPLPSGVYFYRLSTREGHETKKMIMVQ